MDSTVSWGHPVMLCACVTVSGGGRAETMLPLFLSMSVIDICPAPPPQLSSSDLTHFLLQGWTWLRELRTEEGVGEETFSYSHQAMMVMGYSLQQKMEEEPDLL
jgi:hypothetical protein